MAQGQGPCLTWLGAQVRIPPASAIFQTLNYPYVSVKAFPELRTS